MGKVLINPTEKGNVAVFMPSPGVEITEELAKKVVPNGVPYKIIDDSLLPEDHTFFDAWEADFSKPDGYGGTEGFNG